MSLYSSVVMGKNLSLLQIEAPDYFTAVEKMVCEYFKETNGKTVREKSVKIAMENCKVSRFGKNFYGFDIEILKEKILIFIIETIPEALYYNYAEAAKSIFPLLSIESKQSITDKNDVIFILEMEGNYQKEMGFAMGTDIDDPTEICVDGTRLNEIDEEDLVKFISIKALEQGKKLSNDAIEEVLDYEYEYMVKNGFFEKEKFKSGKVEFEMPEGN